QGSSPNHALPIAPPIHQNPEERFYLSPGEISGLIEPFNRLGQDDPARRVVIVGGAQIGKTQLMLNALAFWVATDPKPIMAIWPTIDVAKRLVTTRVDPTFARIPAVQARLLPERTRARGAAMFLRKLIGGAELIVAGANAPAPLRSSPINYALLDEVSAMGATIEGDVLDLVAERQNTYGLTCKTLAISTPLDEGTCLITRAYSETDQRRYMVPCLHCGHRFPISFGDVRWPKGEPDKAALVCPSCGCAHDDFDKRAQLAQGRWEATAEASDTTAVGYHVPGLLSPWLSYAAIAKKHRAAGKDPVRLRVFVNATLAEVWRDEEGDDLADTDLAARRETWPAGEVPEGAVCLTAGCDIQDDRVEVTVAAWGPGEESWIVAHRVIWGDPAGTLLWDELDDFLLSEWRHPSGAMLPIRATAVDSGAHTLRVYDFVKPRSKRRVWPVKGSTGKPGAPLWPKAPTRNNKARVALFILNTLAGKEAIWSRLKLTEPGAGYLHFHADLPPSYFEGLTGERPVVRYSKGRAKREWVPISGRRNEAFDCLNYCLAALHGLKSAGLDLDREAHTLATATAPRPKKPPVVKSKWLHG
ncbi:MAG: phage terminase large subunit family protein, partial [Alphaproteobacteria bacterium]|nr:phage terminase large subunit family protein [Alphaproteobacteria bacterium]